MLGMELCLSVSLIISCFPAYCHHHVIRIEPTFPSGRLTEQTTQPRSAARPVASHLLQMETALAQNLCIFSRRPHILVGFIRLFLPPYLPKRLPALEPAFHHQPGKRYRPAHVQTRHGTHQPTGRLQHAMELLQCVFWAVKVGTTGVMSNLW